MTRLFPWLFTPFFTWFFTPFFTWFFTPFFTLFFRPTVVGDIRRAMPHHLTPDAHYPVFRIPAATPLTVLKNASNNAGSAFG